MRLLDRSSTISGIFFWDDQVLERLRGRLEAFIRAGLRHCEKLAIIDAHAAGETEAVTVPRIGPDPVFRAALERKRHPRSSSVVARSSPLRV